MVAGDNNNAVGGRTRWTGPGQGGVADEPKHVVACCRLRALTDDVATAVSSMRTFSRVTFPTEVQGEDEPPTGAAIPDPPDRFVERAAPKRYTRRYHPRAGPGCREPLAEPRETR